MALLSLSWHKQISLTVLKIKKMSQSVKNASYAKSERESMYVVLLLPYILIYNYIYSYTTISPIIILIYKLTKCTFGIIVIINKKVELNIFKSNKLMPNRLAF